MEPFTELTAIAAPLDLRHVDTDCIIPARFLRNPRAEFGKAMFHDIRVDGEGNKLDFVLNNPAYYNARVLVADENFGCGSSREAAVWALAEHDGSVMERGFRCIIAPSFGDIFYNNCSKNGVLPVRLSVEACAGLRQELSASIGATVTVDLNEQTVEFPSGRKESFEIDSTRKHCLLNGLDDVALTQKFSRQVAEYEASSRESRPWLFIPG